MEYCEEQGIRRFLTASYSPQQNSAAERKNQTIFDMVRSILKRKKMPKEFWTEAVQYKRVQAIRSDKQEGDVRVNEASEWDWNNLAEAIIEVGESSVVAPTSIPTNSENIDDEDEPRQPKIRSLQDLYDSTNEVHHVCVLADAENISFKEVLRDK
ncbi:uncharacterized protein LOC120171924 [Hibiscus syriacus]|uniref:uncharacterized protein LOC120171924 n=1 Tax=Hibiscus syriacus TaxID=106335 RepID=UPI001922BC14|nr:uncharacterized protein LOC120171924 [Hibiscus syriacus]